MGGLDPLPQSPRSIPDNNADNESLSTGDLSSRYKDQDFKIRTDLVAIDGQEEDVGVAAPAITEKPDEGKDIVDSNQIAVEPAPMTPQSRTRRVKSQNEAAAIIQKKWIDVRTKIEISPKKRREGSLARCVFACIIM